MISSDSSFDIFKIFLIRYEDLKFNSEKVFSNLVKFINQLLKNNQGVDQQKLDKAIKTTRFDFLKKKKMRVDLKKRCFQEKKIKKYLFLIMDFDTSWKNHLKENIVEKIEKEFMNEMKEVGYL